MTTQPNQPTKAQTMQVGSSDVELAVLQNILSSRLYSRPVEAVVREYVMNARDAVRAAGHDITDRPIQITLPDISNDWTFSVADRGTGMNAEQIENVFTVFSGSSKRQDSLATGELGLGAKSGFAVADQITVSSTKDGSTSVVVLSTQDAGLKEYQILTRATPDLSNGTTVQLKLRPEYRSMDWSRESRRALFWVPASELEIANLDRLVSVGRPETLEVGPGVHLAPLSNDRNPICIAMGSIIYKIEDLKTNDQIQELATTLGRITGWSMSIIIEVENKSLPVNPSRESIQPGEQAEKTLTTRLNEALRNILDWAVEELDQWFQNLSGDNMTVVTTNPRHAGDPRDSTWWMTVIGKISDHSHLSDAPEHVQFRGGPLTVGLPNAYLRNRSHILSSSPGRVSPLDVYKLPKMVVTDAALTETESQRLAEIAHSITWGVESKRAVTVFPGEAPGWINDDPRITVISAGELLEREIDVPEKLGPADRTWRTGIHLNHLDMPNTTRDDLLWKPTTSEANINDSAVTSIVSEIHNMRSHGSERILVNIHQVPDGTKRGTPDDHHTGLPHSIPVEIYGPVDEVSERAQRLRELLEGQDLENVSINLLHGSATVLSDVQMLLPGLKEVTSELSKKDQGRAATVGLLEVRLRTWIEHCLRYSTGLVTLGPNLSAIMQNPSGLGRSSIHLNDIGRTLWRKTQPNDQAVLEHLPLMQELMADRVRAEALLSVMTGVGRPGVAAFSNKFGHQTGAQEKRTMRLQYVLDTWG